MSSTDLQTLVAAVLWSSWLWPLIVVGIATALVRTKVRSALAYYLFGVLICYGLGHLVGLTGTYALVNNAVASMYTDEQFGWAVASGMSASVAVVVLASVPILYWLRRAMRRDS